MDHVSYITNGIQGVHLLMSNWILIGTTLFLGAIALIVPYLSELVKRRLFAPKLKVHFRESSPGCHKARFKGRNASGHPIEA